MDKNGELWSGGMARDRVLRFYPQSGRGIEYLLPARPTFAASSSIIRPTR
jgi:hypothetical protein